MERARGFALGSRERACCVLRAAPWLRLRLDESEPAAAQPGSIGAATGARRSNRFDGAANSCGTGGRSCLSDLLLRPVSEPVHGGPPGPAEPASSVLLSASGPAGPDPPQPASRRRAQRPGRAPCRLAELHPLMDAGVELVGGNILRGDGAGVRPVAGKAHRRAPGSGERERRRRRGGRRPRGPGSRRRDGRQAPAARP